MIEAPRESRREFLHTSTTVAAGAAAVGAPTIVPASVFASPAPSDKIVIGSIGTGDLGRRHHLNNKLLPNPRFQVAAVCDVDRNHRDQAAKDCFARTGRKVGVYKDFRELCDRQDIDAVLVATPDHWHALCSIYAMESGKDVYCEKPLTLTIAEGQKMVETARRYGAVVQTGSQQRNEGPFYQAVTLARNGVIGKLQRIEARIGGIDAGSWQKPVTPPPELDWDMWLGPAPFAEYVPNRVHYQFRWFSDYSGGKMTDWGAHHLDIAQWAIGADGSGPAKVKTVAAKFHPEGPHDVAGHFHMLFTYGSEHGNVELHVFDGERNGFRGEGENGGENGVKMVGSNGWLFVSRGRIELNVGGKSLKNGGEIAKAYPMDKFATKLYGGRQDHHGNWIDCIKSRELPVCDVEIGHRSCSVCHLGNIALKLNRELNWDPKAESFVGDEQANLMRSRPMRAPWTI